MEDFCQLEGFLQILLKRIVNNLSQPVYIGPSAERLPLSRQNNNSNGFICLDFLKSNVKLFNHRGIERIMDFRPIKENSGNFPILGKNNCFVCHFFITNSGLINQAPTIYNLHPENPNFIIRNRGIKAHGYA